MQKWRKEGNCEQEETVRDNADSGDLSPVCLTCTRKAGRQKCQT